VGDKKILIVDHDPDVQQGMYARLKANHYDILFAGDALSSVTVARKNEPDLMILDLRLPAGDGFVVMERLRSVSTLETFSQTKRVRSRQERNFLQRPVDNAELQKVIRQALGEPALAMITGITVLF
jgi:DNA-binding response OmpR family regulator